MDHPGARDRDARARSSGEVADGAGGVARRLLVAEAEVVDAFLLDRRRHAVDRIADDAERVLDALRLERLGDDGAAADLGGGSRDGDGLAHGGWGWRGLGPRRGGGVGRKTGRGFRARSARFDRTFADVSHRIAPVTGSVSSAMLGAELVSARSGEQASCSPTSADQFRRYGVVTVWPDLSAAGRSSGR